MTYRVITSTDAFLPVAARQCMDELNAMVEQEGAHVKILSIQNHVVESGRTGHLWVSMVYFEVIDWMAASEMILAERRETLVDLTRN